jgi:hypothetical protein
MTIGLQERPASSRQSRLRLLPALSARGRSHGAGPLSLKHTTGRSGKCPGDAACRRALRRQGDVPYHSLLSPLSTSFYPAGGMGGQPVRSSARLQTFGGLRNDQDGPPTCVCQLSCAGPPAVLVRRGFRLTRVYPRCPPPEWSPSRPRPPIGGRKVHRQCPAEGTLAGRTSKAGRHSPHAANLEP